MKNRELLTGLCQEVVSWGPELPVYSVRCELHSNCCGQSEWFYPTGCGYAASSRGTLADRPNDVFIFQSCDLTIFDPREAVYVTG